MNGLELLCDACDAACAAGAGGRLLDADGRPQIGFMARQLPTAATLILESLLLNRICPNNRVNRRYRGLDCDYSSRFQVEQPAGAFLMIRREVWAELGGFDEAFYPLWFEDVDFCRRAIDRGYRMYFEPGAVAKHTARTQSQALSLEVRRFYWYRSLLKYSAKTSVPGHFVPCAWLWRRVRFCAELRNPSSNAASHPWQQTGRLCGSRAETFFAAGGRSVVTGPLRNRKQMFGHSGSRSWRTTTSSPSR